MSDILQLSVATSDIYSSELPCQTFTAQHCHVRHLQLSIAIETFTACVPMSDIYRSVSPCQTFTAQCSHVRHLQLSVPMSDIYRLVFPCQTFTAQHFHVRHLPISVPMSDIYRSVFLCQTFTVQHCHVWHLHNPPHMHMHIRTHTHTHTHTDLYLKYMCEIVVGNEDNLFFLCRRVCPSWTMQKWLWMSWSVRLLNRVWFWQRNRRRLTLPWWRSPPACR